MIHIQLETAIKTEVTVVLLGSRHTYSVRRFCFG